MDTRFMARRGSPPTRTSVPAFERFFREHYPVVVRIAFGVTGDLANKQIFPALYAMVKRGDLNVPVVGVAFPNWSLERLHRRATQSIEHAGGQGGSFNGEALGFEQKP